MNGGLNNKFSFSCQGDEEKIQKASQKGHARPTKATTGKISRYVGQ